MFVPQVFHILLPFAVRYPTVAWGGLLAPSPGKLLMAAFILWRKRGKSWRKDFSSSTLSSAQSRPQDRFLSRCPVLLGMSLDKTHFLDIGSLDVPGFAGKQSSVPTWFLWVHTRSKALSILVPWHLVCVLCHVAPDAEAQCILRSLELRCMNGLSCFHYVGSGCTPPCHLWDGYSACPQTCVGFWFTTLDPLCCLMCTLCTCGSYFSDLSWET